ncbi:MAG: hypothetical protein H6643_16495 [Caldilineaceae bacterium]|nr:hypothetical protein [Caldilineaceae bacterium]
MLEIFASDDCYMAVRLRRADGLGVTLLRSGAPVGVARFYGGGARLDLVKMEEKKPKGHKDAKRRAKGHERAANGAGGIWGFSLPVPVALSRPAQPCSRG